MGMNLWKFACVVCALLLYATGKCKGIAGSGEYYMVFIIYYI